MTRNLFYDAREAGWSKPTLKGRGTWLIVDTGLRPCLSRVLVLVGRGSDEWNGANLPHQLDGSEAHTAAKQNETQEGSRVREAHMRRSNTGARAEAREARIQCTTQLKGSPHLAPACISTRSPALTRATKKRSCGEPGREHQDTSLERLYHHLPASLEMLTQTMAILMTPISTW